MPTRIGSGGTCGFLEQYRTARNNTNGAPFFALIGDSNPLIMTPRPGFLTYFKVVVNNPPASGLVFQLQERGTVDQNADEVVYSLFDVSPLLVPVLDSTSGDPISGIEWEFVPPVEEWLRVDHDLFVRLGQGYDKGLVIQAFAADGGAPPEGTLWNINCRFVETTNIANCRNEAMDRRARGGR